MKNLICNTGTLAFDGNVFKRGDTFQVDDELADHLLEHRVVTIAEPETPTLELDPPLELSDRPPGIPDISTMNTKTAVDFVRNQTDPQVLDSIAQSEQSGKNRRTILKAIALTKETME